jgi:hypothetical protein
MRQTKKYTRIIQSYEAEKQAVNYDNQLRYNPALVIEYKGNKYITGAGYSDKLTVFVDKEEIAILSQNDKLGYCGIQFLDIQTGKETASAFFHEHETSDKEASSYKLDRMNPRKAFNIIGQYYIN